MGQHSRSVLSLNHDDPEHLEILKAVYLDTHGLPRHFLAEIGGQFIRVRGGRRTLPIYAERGAFYDEAERVARERRLGVAQ